MCNTNPIDPRLASKLKDSSILINGCACAIIDVEDDGRVVYDYLLLIDHFHEHEGMWEHDEEDETGTTAMEWIDYNVIRGIAYMTDGIKPRIVDSDSGCDFCGGEDEDE